MHRPAAPGPPPLPARQHGPAYTRPTMLLTPTAFTPLLAVQDHPAPASFVFRGDALLVRADDLALPDAATLARLDLADAAFHAVGALEERYCRTAWLPAEADAPEGYTFTRLRALFGAIGDDLLAVAGRAFQIGHWARTHRFCGACGTPTAAVPGERCVKCPACGHTAYPRISPAMMVLVKRGRDLLLARHTTSPAPFFTALAGFVEAGESVEDAVHREVAEEVGLQVRDLRYFGSQPWPFPHSLMIAFTAEYAGGEIRTDPAEIAEARWFRPDEERPLTPSARSIAGDLLAANWPAAT